MKELVLNLMEERHIYINEMAEILMDIQRPYVPEITMDDCLNAIDCVLDKREVHNAILTGLALDIAAENHELPEALCEMIINDDPLYGMDESVGFAISTIYGSIGLSNYGFLDKSKPGLISRLNDDKNQVNTYADDIAGAIIAAAAARLAHNKKEEL